MHDAPGPRPAVAGYQPAGATAGLTHLPAQLLGDGYGSGWVVRFGRQPSLTAFQIAHAQETSGAGKPIAEIAKIFGDRATIYRVLAAPVRCPSRTPL